MKINEKLMNIQRDLKAPKGQMNKFGGYKYRSCEDIVEAVKPLLNENKCVLKLTDEMVCLGDRYYVKATAILSDIESEDYTSTTAFARESENRKGMDDSQITGSASSYARKYALNGLFGIDDTKDADSTNTHGKETKSKPTKKKSTKKVSEDEILEIEKLISEVGVDKAKFQKWLKTKYNASKIDDIPQVNYAEVIGALESKKEDK